LKQVVQMSYRLESQFLGSVSVLIKLLRICSDSVVQRQTGIIFSSILFGAILMTGLDSVKSDFLLQLLLLFVLMTRLRLEN